MSSCSESVRAAVRIAFRHFAELDEANKELVLVALIETSHDIEGRAAQDALFDMRKARDSQMLLKAIVEGIGK